MFVFVRSSRRSRLRALPQDLWTRLFSVWFCTKHLCFALEEQGIPCEASPHITGHGQRPPAGACLQFPRGALATVRTRFMLRFLIWTKESKSGKSFWENRFLERTAKHGLLFQIQSRHLNILFWGNLGNPDSVPKAMCPPSPKLPRLGNLGMIGEGQLWAPPLARSKIGLY